GLGRGPQGIDQVTGRGLQLAVRFRDLPHLLDKPSFVALALLLAFRQLFLIGLERFAHGLDQCLQPAAAFLLLRLEDLASALEEGFGSILQEALREEPQILLDLAPYRPEFLELLLVSLPFLLQAGGQALLFELRKIALFLQTLPLRLQLLQPRCFPTQGKSFLVKGP